jgi:hypothetical protein
MTMTPSASQQATTNTSTVAPASPIDPSPADATSMDPTRRHVMIAEAAFYISQARGFTPSQELDDWLAAEREIEQRLSNPDH